MFGSKKYLVKNLIIILFILIVTAIITNKIYYKFINERNIDMKYASLNITYHQKTGNKVQLTKVTPVTDSVGLSSKEYSFTIENKTDKKINYNILLEDDKKRVKEDECGEYQIPNEIIKVSLKTQKGKDLITDLSKLENNILKNDIIKPGESKDYTIRVWTGSNTLLAGSNMHMHKNIKVNEVK